MHAFDAHQALDGLSGMQQHASRSTFERSTRPPHL
jgi:hypothetical protein